MKMVSTRVISAATNNLLHALADALVPEAENPKNCKNIDDKINTGSKTIFLFLTTVCPATRNKL